jgi:hypothetical protein
MLEYFPTNYVWNFSTNLAIGMGGSIGAIDIISAGFRRNVFGK